MSANWDVSRVSSHIFVEAGLRVFKSTRSVQMIILA